MCPSFMVQNICLFPYKMTIRNFLLVHYLSIEFSQLIIIVIIVVFNDEEFLVKKSVIIVVACLVRM